MSEKEQRMHRKKSMSRKKLTIVSLVAVPLVAGLGFAVTQAAFAGPNGQEITLCQPKSDYRSAIIEGENQDGTRTTHPTRLSDQECNMVKGFFWKGRVEITWQDSASLPDKKNLCNVPVASSEETIVCKSDDLLLRR